MPRNDISEPYVYRGRGDLCATVGVGLMTPAGGSASPKEVDDGLGQTEKDADSKGDALLLRD